MWQTARHTILLIFILICMLPTGSSALQPNTIYGASADGTVTAVPACGSSGFSVESTLTLTGFTDARFLRVNNTTRKNNGGIGYVVGGNGDLAQIWLAAFDMDTMALLGTYQIQPAGGGGFGTYTNNGRYAGDTSGNDLYIYMFNRAAGFGGTCGGVFTCASLLKFTGASFIGVGNDTAIPVAQLDDAKFISATSILVMDSDGAGFRRPTLWSSASLTRLGSGATFGTSGFTMVSDGMGGNNYVNQVTSTTNYRLPAGTTVFDASKVIAYGASRIAQAIYTLGSGSDLVATESGINGAFPSVRDFMIGSTMTDLGLAATYVANDGTSAWQSTFFDSINNKVYSVRADGGFGYTAQIIRTDPLATIEQRFACGTCLVNASQGIQASDFNQNMARLYLVNTSNPPVVNKIKVCATGGP